MLLLYSLPKKTWVDSKIASLRSTQAVELCKKEENYKMAPKWRPTYIMHFRKFSFYCQCICHQWWHNICRSNFVYISYRPKDILSSMLRFRQDHAFRRHHGFAFSIYRRLLGYRHIRTKKCRINLKTLVFCFHYEMPWVFTCLWILHRTTPQEYPTRYSADCNECRITSEVILSASKYTSYRRRP